MKKNDERLRQILIQTIEQWMKEIEEELTEDNNAADKRLEDEKE